VLPILFRLPDWFPFLGGEPITSFGVMMFASFMTAGYILRIQMQEGGIDPDRAWDMVFMAVLGGILGAKGYYLILNWGDFMANPGGMLLSRGGLVWYGGFFMAGALVLWKVRQMGLPIGLMTDYSAPALALAYAVGRMGCFLVGDDYGRPTDSWVGIAFPEGAPPTRVDILERSFGITVDPALIAKYGDVVPVHPTQLYEVGMSTLIFFFLWRIRGHDRQRGWLFMVWLALAGVERFIVEIFRAKDDRFLGVFTVAQLISVILVAVGIWGMMRLAGPRGEEEPIGGAAGGGAAARGLARAERRRRAGGR
jgi:phosphatidylglycerol---prolipoprotein diacylglyceryl transferase